MKLTEIEQIDKIDLQENNLYYIYGKTGSGKTYFTKQVIKKNKKEAFYTNFEEVISLYSKGEVISEDIIVIDNDIEKTITKEFTCLIIQKIIEKWKEEGKKIFVISSLTPQKLQEENELVSNLLLNNEIIEICYNIESRIKIAEQYSKKLQIIINQEILKSIAKEENIGKIRASINKMKIA